MEKSIEYKKKKVGRPRQEDVRNKTTGLRLNQIEHFIIRQNAQKAGLPFSEYIREMAVKGMVRSSINDEERTILRQLIGMANNINQLAKLAHTQGLLTAMLQFEQYRNSIDTVIEKLRP